MKENKNMPTDIKEVTGKLNSELQNNIINLNPNRSAVGTTE